jgi:radical SAM superfamily enzyme YgiQ (UPF0313 family)
VRVFASSLRIWKVFDERQHRKGRHDLTFSLAVVGAIGADHGLVLVPEELTREAAHKFDAVFVNVMDSRTMVDAAKHFARWKLPFRRRERGPEFPFVWAGGQGLRNPLPFSEVADLIVLGDAEEPLPRLLALWDQHGRTQAFLEEAAAVPGVFVPSVHDRHQTRLQLRVSDDIGISLRSDIRVSLDKSRRLEIARGCPYRCPYCSLGWRAKYRESRTEDILSALDACPKRVHLQAGDAESHSGIVQLRAELLKRGQIDLGWTGRLDTVIKRLRYDGSSIPAQKRYAVGIEGVSHRLRRAIGKPLLTDDAMVEWNLELLDRIEDDRIGRTCWHLMGGLPTEDAAMETQKLLSVLRRIDHVRRHRSAKYLEIHWQPFQPLPGTPMQWCASGRVSKYAVHSLTVAEDFDNIKIIQYVGRTNDMAKICTILSRADERGAVLLEALGGPKIVTVEEAERICGTSFGELDPTSPLPWDFIDSDFPRPILEREYLRVSGSLAAP